jgi:hypothetical protein
VGLDNQIRNKDISYDQGLMQSAKQFLAPVTCVGRNLCPIPEEFLMAQMSLQLSVISKALIMKI